MVQSRNTLWFGPKSSNSWPWLCDPDWDREQCPRLIFWSGALNLNPVRSGQTWWSTSRPQLKSKSNLIPKLIFSFVELRYGDTADWRCLVLFPFFPPNTSHSRHRKIKNLHIFVKALPFSPFTVRVDLRSESSWLEPSESPSPLSLAPTAARWRRPRGHRWLWPSQTDGHIESPSAA